MCFGFPLVSKTVWQEARDSPYIFISSKDHALDHGVPRLPRLKTTRGLHSRGANPKPSKVVRGRRADNTNTAPTPAR